MRRRTAYISRGYLYGERWSIGYIPILDLQWITKAYAGCALSCMAISTVLLVAVLRGEEDSGLPRSACGDGFGV